MGKAKFFQQMVPELLDKWGVGRIRMNFDLYLTSYTKIQDGSYS